MHLFYIDGTVCDLGRAEAYDAQLEESRMAAFRTALRSEERELLRAERKLDRQIERNRKSIFARGLAALVQSFARNK